MRSSSLLLALLALALPASAVAQGAEDVRGLQALDARCEQARQQALAPLKEKLQKQCEQEPARARSADPRQECATELSTYGNKHTTANGSVVQGLFYDLPECRQAQEAWAQWERNRPWK